MSLPAMHGWTHRPKSQGGTDPIPVAPAGDLKWAMASGSPQTITPSGGVYRCTFNGMYVGTGSATDFGPSGVSGGRASFLQINTPGYYLARFTVIKSGSVWSTAGETFIQPLFSLSGSDASIQDNQGVADYLGDWFNPRCDIVNAQPAYAGSLNIDLTFNWNPDDPVSDLDFENPLQIAVHVATFPSDSVDLSLGSMVFVHRIADAGYVDVSPV